jgi:hypothetical protein
MTLNPEVLDINAASMALAHHGRMLLNPERRERGGGSEVNLEMVEK